MKKNLIIYVSSRNNYDMFEEEVLKNIFFDGFEFINVDDKSSVSEIEKGMEICKKNNIIFLQNKNRGIQFATQTLVDFINENRPKCKFVICFQHDGYPISNNFFNRISKLIKDGKLNDFGAIGFNVIDMGKYTFDAFQEWKNGEKPIGMLGLNHLSNLSTQNRWISPHHNPIAVHNPQNWINPFIIELPMWAAVGINVKHWNDCIEPTDEYHFHLWFPDIAMQLNYNNKPILVLPELYTINRQELKSKYNIDENSAQGAMKGNEYHFGKYSNFNAWKERWGWEYENVGSTYLLVSESYNGTLINDYFNHDIMETKKPFRSYNLGEY